MGRMRIKRKETVIPFRETVAYRLIIAAGCLVVFMISMYILVGAISSNVTTAIISGSIAMAATIGLFYNLDHLREARVPKRTINRMKRR